MQIAQSLNCNWFFKKGFEEKIVTAPLETEDPGFEKVHVPHTVQMIPYDCFDQYMTCMISTYVKHFSLQDVQGKRVLVSFEGVSAYYDLYCNGALAGSHRGAFSMALFDLTEFVREGDNRLVLMVDSNERADIPPNGSTVDFLIYGGIYRDVTLYVQEDTYIRQPLMRYDLQLTECGGQDRACSRVRLKPELLVSAQNAGTVRVEMCLRRPGAQDQEAPVFRAEAVCSIIPGEQSLFPGEWEAELLLWDTDDPVLYEVSFALHGEDGRLLDTASVRTGFRSIRVDADGFYLNGRRISLIGLNRHQSYPYAGFAMGRRSQEKDAELLKEFLGVNMVRCSHYMQSGYFLDRCDELGLLVFEEIPGWGYLGDETFRQVVLSDLKNMVLGHFNHPAIVIWGSRLNETTDSDEFYELTHRLCREMDPARPTTGARWDTGSRLFEEIYSYNDYSEDQDGEFSLLTAQEAAGTSQKVPYLVSEHTGAILPTKPWDSEERQEQFALRHAKVLSRVLTADGYLGALGWCMFDYNTHNDHNNMSKICFHGVMDMFRVPKMAAYLYASQKSPDSQVILEPCSMVGRGERCEPVPFWVMTNCDYIDVTLSSDMTRRYYPDERFTGLKHPPIEVKENGEFWQKRWIGARITGYVDGKPVAERVYSDNPRLAKLYVEADAQLTEDDGCAKDGQADTFRLRLSGSGVDETRIVVYFKDENGNRLYYHRGVLQVAVTGPLKLIGPQLIPVMGGAAAFWVRTEPEDSDKPDGSAAPAIITLRTDRPEIRACRIRVTADN